MAGKLVQTIRTDPKLEDVWNEVSLKMIALVERVTKEPINLLLAHFVTEVGLDPDETLKACYNYSAGNKRPRRDKAGNYLDDYCLYPCGEELPLVKALDEVSKSPHATIICKYQKQIKDKSGKVLRSEPYASVHFEPPHVACRFRAYNDLRASVEGQFDYLTARSRAWIALLTGDPERYAAVLYDYGYYTASVERYAKCLKASLVQVAKITDKYDWAYII